MTAITTSSTVFTDISDEHRLLENMYARIRGILSRGPGQLAYLRKMFDVLAEELRRHFEHEEQGGYFDELVVMAPHLSARSENLRREHDRLLESLQEMCRAFERAEDTPAWWDVMARNFQDFLRRCEEHESQENQLVQDAWLQDIGIGD